MLFFPCLLSLGIVQVNLTLLSLTRSLEIPLVIQLLRSEGQSNKDLSSALSEKYILV